MKCIYLAAVVLCFGTVASTYSRNDSIRLMDDMLRGYNRKHRPVLNQSEPVKVNIVFQIVSIRDFDEVSGEISLVALMFQEWYDEIIVWDPASYGGITSQIYDVEDVWYPLLVTSSSAVKFEDMVEDWMTLRISSSGLVNMDIGLLIKSTCKIDVTYFPFDEQTCDLTFTPWSESELEIKLQAPIPYGLDTFYTEHGQWKISKNSTYTDPILGYVMRIVLQRKPLFAIVTTILPIVFMTILNLLVYVIPVHTGGRIGYSMTTLLSIAVFLTLVSDSLPKTSEPMSAIAFFLMNSLIFSTCISVSALWTIQIYYRKDTQPIPTWQRKLVMFFRCRCNTERPREYYDIQSSGIQLSVKGGTSTRNSNNALEKAGKEDRPLTWHTVSSALDWFLLTVFSILILFNDLYFIIYLSTN